MMINFLIFDNIFDDWKDIYINVFGFNIVKIGIFGIVEIFNDLKSWGLFKYSKELQEHLDSLNYTPQFIFKEILKKGLDSYEVEYCEDTDVVKSSI